jgi:RNA polymerase sigma-70 factor (ECF subfamily)
MSDQRHVRSAKPVRPAPDTGPRVPARSAGAGPASPQSDDTRLAVEIRGLVEQGFMDEARDKFSALVAAHQRRALRIAYQYLRDTAEADEAVQDAFVKVFTHIATYREAWPFEVWFTRILINGCLDRRKARARRERWFVGTDAEPADETVTETVGGVRELDPEARLLARERRHTLSAAIDRLEGRQRTVFMLCHYGDCSPRDVSAMTGINESTVRVHLFRAVRKLRGFLGGTS